MDASNWLLVQTKLDNDPQEQDLWILQCQTKVLWFNTKASVKDKLVFENLVKQFWLKKIASVWLVLDISKFLSRLISL